MADIPFVDLGAGVTGAIFRFFYLVRPVARSLSRFGQRFNVLPQLLVLGQFEIVLSLLLSHQSEKACFGLF